MVVKLERKRYFLVEFFGRTPEKKELIRELRNKVALIDGQLGLATSSVHVVDILEDKAIIRSTHQSRDLVETAIQLLGEREYIPVVRTVSGTIKKLNPLLEDDGNETMINE
jgi:RNase P/RNase MRP subunit POP5